MIIFLVMSEADDIKPIKAFYTSDAADDFIAHIENDRDFYYYEPLELGE